MSTAPALARTTSANAASSRAGEADSGKPSRAGRADVGMHALRRLPIRHTEPPFDDELDDELNSSDRSAARSRTPAKQTTLTLAFTMASGLPAIPELPEVFRGQSGPSDGPDGSAAPVPGIPTGSGLNSGYPLRLVSSLAPAADTADTASKLAADQPVHRARRRPLAADTDEDFGPRATPRSLLPDPRPWAGRLVQALIEAMAGVRPVSQLVRWTTVEVYESVQDRAIAALHERRGPTPRIRAEVVRSVRVSEPLDGVAEVCAIVQQGPRCRAIALRLEGADGRWQCTALQVG